MNHIDWVAGVPHPREDTAVKLWMLHAPQLSGQRTDGWYSSAGVGSLIVGARSATLAAMRYADTLWLVKGGSWHIRHMYVTVSEVDPVTGDLSDLMIWVRITHKDRTTEAVTGDTYASVKHTPTSEDDYS